MTVKHPCTIGNPTEVQPADFFETMLPQILKYAVKAARRINAVYVFELSGDGGGTWTVDLPALQVRRGSTEDAQFQMAMPANDFRALLAGRLDIDDAIENNRVTWRGQLTLLNGFAALIRPPEVA